MAGRRMPGRVNRRRDLWDLTVEPHSSADVTVTVAAGAACGTPAAVCTKDGRALSNTISATVRGPVGIAVADAHVEEDAGAVLAFAVTLTRAASRALTVDYATSDGSAQAGVDYTAASGTLTFQAGESSKTVEVSVLDDAHDEGEETLTLTLSSASGGLLTDGEATGTIENRDPLPRALLARFGRAAAVHVVEHVEERLQAPREPGFRGRFAGPGAAAGHGARHGAQLPAPARERVRRSSGGHGRARSDGRLAGGGRCADGDARARRRRRADDGGRRADVRRGRDGRRRRVAADAGAQQGRVRRRCAAGRGSGGARRRAERRRVPADGSRAAATC